MVCQAMWLAHEGQKVGGQHCPPCPSGSAAYDNLLLFYCSVVSSNAVDRLERLASHRHESLSYLSSCSIGVSIVMCILCCVGVSVLR